MDQPRIRIKSKRCRQPIFYRMVQNKLEQQIKEYESVVADKNNVIVSLENSNKELDSTNKHQNQSIN